MKAPWQHPWLGVLVLTIAAFLALVLISLNSKPDMALAGKTQVRLQLQWFDQAQFAGFYVAQAKNFYDKENLNVEIIAGGYNINPVDVVDASRAEIGIATADQVLLRRAGGVRIKALGNVFNKSLACFMVKDTSPIRGPQDFPNHRIGQYAGFDTENILLSLLRLHNIQRRDVNIVNAAGNLDAFRTDAIEAYPSYVINEPLTLAQEGLKTRLILPDQYGVNYCSDTIFATERYYAQHRAVLTRFLRATALGWQYARDHQAEAIAIMYNGRQNLSKTPEGQQHQSQMLAEAVKHLGGGNQNRILYMDRTQWVNMEDLLVGIGKIPSGGICDSLCDFRIAEEASQ